MDPSDISNGGHVEIHPLSAGVVYGKQSHLSVSLLQKESDTSLQALGPCTEHWHSVLGL